MLSGRKQTRAGRTAVLAVRTLFLFAFLGCCIVVPADYGQTSDHIRDYIIHYKYGSINWTTGEITARARVSPLDNTEKEIESLPGSARAAANRNLIHLLKQIKISRSVTVGQYAAANDTILGGIEKTARDAQTILQTYTSAMDLEVRISMNFPGAFLQLALPEEICQISLVSQEEKQPLSPSPPPDTAIPGYTGLIIDASHLDVEPVLYPVIIDENGREIYSSQFMSREFAVQSGVCTYAPNLSAARTTKRLGKNPLVVTAIRRAPSPKKFLVISSADAKKLEKRQERHEFLQECRVAIVCKMPSRH